MTAASPSHALFLTAHWANLTLLTYRVPPRALEPYLPPGTEPDVQDGSAFASLVGFDFLDTRVLGIPWPGFRNFPEFNLRLYVRRGEERGVVFVREIVPQRFVAWVARTLYGEPYYAAPIHNERTETSDRLAMTYRFTWQGRPQTMHVEGAKPATTPGLSSDAHYFKEHQWGFGTTRTGKIIRYEVAHPTWRTYNVQSYRLDLDWAHVYGPGWAFLQDEEPFSVVLAEGSDVRVYWRSGLGKRTSNS
ncbi:MAG: YqjF family protein [Rhodothermales bacterium]